MIFDLAALALFVVGMALPLVAATVGFRVRRGEGNSRLIWGLSVATTVLLGALFFSIRESDVTVTRALTSAAVGASLYVLVPVGVYFVVGLKIERSKWLAGFIVISVVLLIPYLGVAALIAYTGVACPPNAYECPV